MLSTGVETSDEARLSLVKALLSVEESCVLEGYGVRETMEGKGLDRGCGDRGPTAPTTVAESAPPRKCPQNM